MRAMATRATVTRASPSALRTTRAGRRATRARGDDARRRADADGDGATNARARANVVDDATTTATTTTTTTGRACVGGAIDGGMSTRDARAMEISVAAACAAAISAAALSVFALEGARRKRVADRAAGRDPDEEVLRAAVEVAELAESMARRWPSEKTMKRAKAARAEATEIRRRRDARRDAAKRAEEWKERVRVKGGEGEEASEGDAERARLDAELAARARAKEAREKKAPMPGASAQWTPADEYLNSILRKESAAHPVDDAEVVRNAEVESSPRTNAREAPREPEYPPELVEAMKRMEADIASGAFSEEALLEKYADVLDTFGEEFDPVNIDDDDDKGEHPQLLDPYWWRDARALHLIMITPMGSRDSRLFAMQMVPDNIPPRARPEDKFHVLAFENKSDAEKFCFFMQSKREDEDLDDALRGLVTMTGIGPKELQKVADDAGYGVTVVGAGRVDLSANRPHVDVLNHITHIGGEVYLWEFARKVKRDFDAENGGAGAR